MITFRGVSPSDELCDLVRAKLAHGGDRIPSCQSCRVIIESMLRARDGLSMVSADVELLGIEGGIRVFVHASHIDAGMAIRRAFDSLGRPPHKDAARGR